jgi:hypothetical protein
MRANCWPLLLALFAMTAASAPREAKGGRVCPHLARNYARLADLPRGARDAFDFPIAERGARWNPSDAVGPGPLLPFARFISALGAGCTLAVRYEYGGIAHGFATAILAHTDHGWTLRRRR